MMLIGMALMGAVEPPRPTELWVSSQQPLVELQACVSREWSRMGRVTPLPLKDGVILDFQLSPFGAPGKAVTSLEIRDKGSERKLTVFYRHPWSVRTAYNWFRDTANRCFSEEWKAANLTKPSK